MAKRFTDSDKWKKQWFRRLSPAYKCFWSYVLDNCNNAGIWDVDFEAASFHVGEDLNAIDVMAAFRKQYHPFALGKRWFIVDFIDFQYVELKASSNAHLAVINTLKKHGLYEIYCLKQKAEADQLYEKQADLRDPRGVQEQEQEQDQVKEQEQDLDLNAEKKSKNDEVSPESIKATKASLLKVDFEVARKAYPGTKGGFTVEWANFEKKNTGNLGAVIPLLLPAIEAERVHKDAINATRADPLQWKHFATWINKRCWEQELEAINGKNGSSGGNSGGYETASQRNLRKLKANLGITGAQGPDRGPALNFLPELPAGTARAGAV